MREFGLCRAPLLTDDVKGIDRLVADLKACETCSRIVEWESLWRLSLDKGKY